MATGSRSFGKSFIQQVIDTTSHSTDVQHQTFLRRRKVLVDDAVVLPARLQRELQRSECLSTIASTSSDKCHQRDLQALHDDAAVEAASAGSSAPPLADRGPTFDCQLCLEACTDGEWLSCGRHMVHATCLQSLMSKTSFGRLCPTCFAAPPIADSATKSCASASSKRSASFRSIPTGKSTVLRSTLLRDIQPADPLLATSVATICLRPGYILAVQTINGVVYECWLHSQTHGTTFTRSFSKEHVGINSHWALVMDDLSRLQDHAMAWWQVRNHP